MTPRDALEHIKRLRNEAAQRTSTPDTAALDVAIACVVAVITRTERGGA